jgi:hypothetical protein
LRRARENVAVALHPASQDFLAAAVQTAAFRGSRHCPDAGHTATSQLARNSMPRLVARRAEGALRVRLPVRQWRHDRRPRRDGAGKKFSSGRDLDRPAARLHP